MHVVNMAIKYGSCCMTGEMLGYGHRKFAPNQYRETPSEWLVDYYGEGLGGYLQKQDVYVYGDIIYAKGDTEEQAWKNALNKLQEMCNEYSYKGVQVRYFWFVDYNRDGNTFEAKALMDLVEKLPNVVNLGRHTNSNTHNLLQGYMAVFKNEPHENDAYDEEDDDE